MSAVRCPRCFGSGPRCICARLVPIVTRTRLVIVQHELEHHQVSNTGRIAALALPNLELRVADRAAQLDDLGAPGTVLLFPGGATELSFVPTRVVLVDASWSQARRMVQKNSVLRGLPRLSLEVSKSAPSVRRAPAGGVSTLQAVARCVAMLEGEAVAQQIDAVHAMLVERVASSRGYVEFAQRLPTS